MATKKLLVRGNRKLGKDIFAFNLPPITTCPGATEVCKSYCYANRTVTQYGAALVAALNVRYTASKLPDFVKILSDEITATHSIKTLRIHVSGDFYDAAYIRSWEKIIQAFPSIVFYAYTRSWRVPKLLTQLERLRRLPNMQLWYSTDVEASNAPEGHVCYMATSDADNAPDDAILAFRVKRKTLLKRSGSKAIVCPFENGVKPKEPLSCSKCGICYNNALIKKLSKSNKSVA